MLRVYVWEHGRELASMTNGTTTWTYAYDANGMRTSRSNGTTTYKYVYNGSSLVQMTVGSNTLYFTSDTVTFNGTTYYYVTNLQGDIVAILNSGGTAVVQYTYDAWGNILSMSDTSGVSLGTLNPLRYRGYVYDTETGLYYLQSRYYDPEVGRFINADALVSTGQGPLGNNMFAYCGNNPTNRIDPLGTNWWDDFLKDVKDWIEEKQEESEDNIGTATVAVYANGALGGAVSGTFGITYDRQGNIGLVKSISGGGGMPSWGVGGCGTMTNAPTIMQTEGLGTEVGGSVSAFGGSIGADYVTSIDQETGNVYHGGTFSMGVGAAIPIEFHGGASNTDVVCSINIFEIALSFVDWLSGEG